MRGHGIVVSGLAVLALAACSRLSEAEAERIRATFECFKVFLVARGDASVVGAVAIVSHREYYRKRQEAEPAFYALVLRTIGAAEQIQQHRRESDTARQFESWGEAPVSGGLERQADTWSASWKASYDELLATASAVLDKSPADSAAILGEVFADPAQRELFKAYACGAAATRPAAFCADLGKSIK